MLLFLLFVALIIVSVLVGNVISGVFKLIFNIILWGIGLVLGYILIMGVYGAMVPFLNR